MERKMKRRRVARGWVVSGEVVVLLGEGEGVGVEGR